MLQCFFYGADMHIELTRQRVIAQVFADVLSQGIALAGCASDRCNVEVEQLGLRQVLTAWGELSRPAEVLAPFVADCYNFCSPVGE